MNNRHLLSRAIRHHRRILLAGVALFGLIIGSLTTTALVSDSANKAVGDSIRADYGGKSYAIQVRDPDLALPALSQVDGRLTPILETTEDVTFNGGLVQATVRSSDDPTLRLGVIVDGRLPSRPGETSLSISLAEQLGAQVGDNVSISNQESQTLEVTGLIIDPAQAGALKAVTVVDLIDPEDATVWVADSDPFSWTELQNAFDKEALTIRTVSILVDDERTSAKNRYFVYANVIIGVLSFILLIAMSLYLPVLKTALDPSRVGLLAAGQKVRDIRGLALALSVGVVIAGGLLGYLSSAIFAYLFRKSLSNLVGQYWIGVSLPVATPLLVNLAAATLVGALTLWTFASRGKLQLPEGMKLTARRAWFAVGVNIIAAASVGLTLLGAIRFEIALVLILAAAIVAPLSLAQYSMNLAHSLGGPNTRRGLSEAVRASLVLSIAISLLAVLGSGYAARAVHDDRTNQASQRAQPTGSLALYQVPSNAVGDLEQQYSALGGKTVTDWVLPNESGLYVRATRPALIECMSESGITDPFEALGPCGATTSDINPEVFGSNISIVVLGSSEGGPNLGAPDAVQNGSIGLVQFDDTTGMAVDLIIAGNISIDTSLGGTLPALVVPLESDLAENLGLEPSESHLMLFQDFGGLSPQEQAQMRGAAARLAGGAQVAEDNAEEQGTARRIAVVVAVGVATFVGILVAIGGALIRRSSRPVLILVHSVQTTRQAKWLMALGTFAPVAASALLASTWGVAGAWLIGVKDGLGFGYFWMLIPGGAVAVAAIAAILWLRPIEMES